MINLWFLTDPLVCVMDVITTFIAWNIMPLYQDMVLQHFKENTNVSFNPTVLLLLLLLLLLLV